MRREQTILLGLLLVGAAGCNEGRAGRPAEEPDPGKPRDATTQKGRLTSIGTDAYREWYDYDARGRVVQTWWRFDDRTYVASATYGYPTREAAEGEAGTVLSRGTFAHRPTETGESVLYEYDRAGVPRAVVAERPDGERQRLLHRTRTNALGQVTQIVYGTCSAESCDDSSTNRVVTERRYDATTLRLAAVTTKLGTTTLQDFGYAFDPVGNLVELDDRVDDDNDAHFDYDSLDRLAQMESGGFTLASAYDALGNLTRKDRVLGGVRQPFSQTYGGQGRGRHAIATSADATFTYDDNGNLLETSGRVDGDLEISWNADNMPVAVHSATDGDIYRKHFLGDRMWKKVEGATTTWLLPGVRIARTGNEEEVRIYYGRIAELDPDGAFHFHRTDHLGSASLTFDVRGEEEHRASYWAWGEDRESSGDFTPIHRYGFEEQELGTGDPDGRGDYLYDLGARLYLPETGRMASADPFTVDGYNRYAFARNNPVRYTDPSGYSACDPEAGDCDQQGPAPAPAPPPAQQPGALPTPYDAEIAVVYTPFVAAEIVDTDPCQSCREVDRVLGPANDGLGAIGNGYQSFHQRRELQQIADRTTVSKLGTVNLGTASAWVKRGIVVGNRIGGLGDIAEVANKTTNAIDNFGRGNYGDGVADILEAGVNVWGGRTLPLLSPACGPLTVPCAIALGYGGSKTGTFLREVGKATPQVKKAIAETSRTQDLRFALPK